VYEFIFLSTHGTCAAYVITAPTYRRLCLLLLIILIIIMFIIVGVENKVQLYMLVAERSMSSLFND
jgi:hypothetical protein